MIKEFIMKHPILTILVVDSVACNILRFGNNILKTIMACKGVDSANVEIEEEEET